MGKKITRIIFMGTPDFSVPALKSLAADPDFEVCLAVTQPDRPKGRGKKLTAPPVKRAAQTLNIDVYQPEKVNAPEAKAKFSALTPDFYAVAAFGQILSPEILDIPAKYPINIHASLLPKYRGAAPIQAAIMNRDAHTGITTMVMDRKMDAGDILLTDPTFISASDTAQDLHDRLSVMGARLIVKTIRGILDEGLMPRPQDHSKATYAKLLKKRDGKIDWSPENKSVIAHINAMTPWPGAYCDLHGKRLKILKAVASDLSADHKPDVIKPGVIFKCDPNGIHVACGKKSIIIQELRGASGKRLFADAYLRGNPIASPAQFDD